MQCGVSHQPLKLFIVCYTRMDKQQQDDMWQNSDGKQAARWESSQYAVEYTLNQLVLIFKYVERNANMYSYYVI